MQKPLTSEKQTIHSPNRRTLFNNYKKELFYTTINKKTYGKENPLFHRLSKIFTSR